MNVCANCGHVASNVWVAMWDYCPSCKAQPFPIDRKGTRELYDEEMAEFHDA